MTAQLYSILNYPSFTSAHDELQKLLQNKLQWRHNQICINCPDGIDNPLYGTGSLMYDWDKIDLSTKKVAVRENPPNESDFKNLCSVFKGTVFENMYSILMDSPYKIGRIRLMKLVPHKCLSWHVDSEPRIHYPIITDQRCKMVIDDLCFHLEQDKWYWTDTKRFHSAFNGSPNERIHLVASTL